MLSNLDRTVELLNNCEKRDPMPQQTGIDITIPMTRKVNIFLGNLLVILPQIKNTVDTIKAICEP
jgi:hypothetical protein